MTNHTQHNNSEHSSNSSNSSNSDHMGHAEMFKKLFLSTLPLVILIVILSDFIGMLRGMPLLVFPGQQYVLAVLSSELPTPNHRLWCRLPASLIVAYLNMISLT